MNDNIREIVTDGIEVTLDCYIDHEVLKDIPIVGTLVNVWKAKKTISDKIFYIKMERFLRRTKNIDQSSAREWRRKMKDDPESARKIGETIVLCLESQSSLKKCDIIGHLFRKMIENDLSKEVFDRMIHAIWQMYVHDVLEITQIDLSARDEHAINIAKKLLATGFFSMSQTEPSYLSGNVIDYVQMSIIGEFKKHMNDFNWNEK
jgi:hypothetical protein